MVRDLEAESRRAFAVMYDMLNSGKSSIPPEVLEQAKGLAVLHVVRAGLHLNGRYGRGIVMARLKNGAWSPPSFIKTAGIGVGLTAGVEVTNFVMVLNTERALKALTMGNLTLGGNMSVAAGPVGKTSEASASILVPAAIYSYSKSKGMYVGISFEGSAVSVGKDENAKVYGRGISSEIVLSGSIATPTFAKPLHSLLPGSSQVAAPEIRKVAGPRPLPFSEPFNDTFGQIEADMWIPSHPQLSGNTNPPAYSPMADESLRPLPTIPMGTRGRQTCIALYDYCSGEPDDLNFHCGDTITVLRVRDDGWWLGEVENGMAGLFPSNYVRVNE